MFAILLVFLLPPTLPLIILPSQTGILGVMSCGLSRCAFKT